MTSVAMPETAATSRKEHVPAAASRKENALWLLEKMVPGTGVNNLAFAFTTQWRLKLDTLERTLALLLDRHEILRTVFREGTTGLTRITTPPGELRIRIEESHVDVPPAELAGALTEFIGRPFALDGGPLLRAVVYRAAGRDVCCFAVHHLIFDAMSTPVLMAEFSELSLALHRGEPVPAQLREPVPATRDIEPTEPSLAFWRRRLRNFEQTRFELDFGTESETDPLLTGGTVARPLSPEVQEVVAGLRKRLRAPEAVILLAAYYLLLGQHGAGPDLVVGTPVTSRPPAAPRAIGYHVNVVPLRLRLDPADTVATLVRKARDTFLDSLAHADVQVDDLLLEVPRTASWRNTLFQHVFNYARGADSSHLERAGLTGLAVQSGFAKFDLEFFILPTESGLTLRAVYHTRSFTRAEVELLLARYEALLLELAQDTDRPVAALRGWSHHDEDVVAAANSTASPAPAPDVLSAVRRWCAATPDAVAVQDGERAMSYHQLWQAAEQASADLVAAGVGPGDVVAVAAPRSAELAVTVLGTWLAGAAYLPVDPAHPADRTEFVLRDSGAVPAPVSGNGCPSTMCHSRPVHSHPEDVHSPGAGGGGAALDPGSCAYLIYTSGSTGRPKGTLLSHGNLANLVEHFRQELGLQPGAAVLWSTTFGFDISALELFLPLVSGGRVVVAPDEARTDGSVLAELVRRHDVRVVQATPTSWRLVLDAAAEALRGRVVLCGGEGLPAELAQRLAGTGARVYNVYGPTETCIWSTAGPVEAGTGAGPVTVGRPIRDTRVFVAGPAGRELPIGVRGELCIAGAGVALGYHRRPELDADRFGEHPVHGRYYRTGDLARWLPDGTLQVLGRADRQVKLRGNRIELGEVEAALASHPAVRAAAVVLAGDPTSDGVLVACIETGPAASGAGAAPAAGPGLVDELWRHARSQLPAASVPQEYLLLPALPTNASQKVDYPELARRAAARTSGGWDRNPPGSSTATDGSSRAGGTGVHGAGLDGAGLNGTGLDGAGLDGAGEAGLVGLLVGLWAEVLGRPEVTATTNFFANGGHSLLGVRLVQRIEQETGVELRLADLFGQQTPAGLAGLIEEATSGKREI
jgi:amino acid adenylation domain-containing protein